MNDIKIIFFDIDGTLVKLGAKDLSEKTVEALRRLQEKGIKLCIATGRSPAILPKLAVEFDAFLTFNGSLCLAGDQVLHSNPIPYEAVLQLVKNAAERGKPTCVATAKRHAANGWEQDLADYYQVANLVLTVTEDFDQACTEGVYQVMLSARESDPTTVADGVPGVKAVFSWPRAVDVIPENSSKGVGIQKILEHFGYTAQQALAFGDGNNDLEMLQTVGTGVAMGNATDRLKSVADHVCRSAEEDGIYHYCLENGLI